MDVCIGDAAAGFELPADGLEVVAGAEGLEDMAGGFESAAGGFEAVAGGLEFVAAGRLEEVADGPVLGAVVASAKVLAFYQYALLEHLVENYM